jgi:hypothetical protein
MVWPRYVNIISKVNIKVQDGHREDERGYESTKRGRGKGF